MAKSKLYHLVVTLSLAVAGIAQADHNSAWGEGWANMPNDIHNTRIDTRDDDTDAFIDFVRMGSGADSDNRFLTDDTTTGGTAVTGGSVRQGGSRGGRG